VFGAADFNGSAEERKLSEDEALVHLIYGSKFDKSKVTVLADPAGHNRIAVEAFVICAKH